MPIALRGALIRALGIFGAALFMVHVAVHSALAADLSWPDMSLPNPWHTPGAIDPAITQANIAATICKHGYTAIVRPPARLTNQLKSAQLRDWKYADRNPRDFEEDHLISLEFRGTPRDPRNLWPEPYAGQWGARVKDQVEDRLHRLVCAGKLPLATAQHMIATDWISAYRRTVAPAKKH